MLGDGRSECGVWCAVGGVWCAVGGVWCAVGAVYFMLVNILLYGVKRYGMLF